MKWNDFGKERTICRNAEAKRYLQVYWGMGWVWGKRSQNGGSRGWEKNCLNSEENETRIWKKDERNPTIKSEV